MAISDTITATRTGLAARRARHAETVRLEHDLAAYTSAADRLELDAIISRAPAEEAARLRTIVSRLRAA